MNLDGLNETARTMMVPGNGILAADESHPTIEARFETIGVENTELYQRICQEMRTE